MKISRSWLQNYFEKPLPDTGKISDALTFHAFEIEESDHDMMDVKVLPNRAADCLCHRGIAKELSAIFNISIKNDPLRAPIQNTNIESPYLKVEIEDPKKCLRYMGALMRGVRVEPSPDWLREALESVGQRSINNIVDATNYVMLNIGQPLHAFDAKKLAEKVEGYTIGVRDAKTGEKITTLSGEEYMSPTNTLFITDANTDKAIGIAGVKGGKLAEISETTTDIIVESANFDGTTIRRTAQALKLITEASLRFQNRPSPELCAYALRDVLELIKKVAGGEVITIADCYPSRAERGMVTVSLQKINGLLGSNFSKEDVVDVFHRLGLPCSEKNESFEITPPFERTDLIIPEDLVEEVGRILGYDRVPATELPPVSDTPDQARYRGIEKVKDFLIERGFTEVSTQSFAKKGDVLLANPLDKTMPALRANLDENMKKALTQATYVAPLVLAPNQKPKLFEIGTIFRKEGEQLAIKISESVPDLPMMQDDTNYQPRKYTLGAFKPFSAYPFIVRDIAVWVPSGTIVEEVGLVFEDILRESSSWGLAIKTSLFDEFKKGERMSYAFRVVFQSFDKTLTDEEVNEIMQKIATALTEKRYEVR